MDQSNHPQSRTQVTILGAGTMGAGMARRLLDQGFRVAVWDRNSAATAALAKDGAIACETAGEAVASADVVITMLPHEAAVDEVMLQGRALDAIRPGAVWAQMGTVGFAATERLDAAVASRRPQVAFVDAPVSGTRQPARTGHLVILASGPEPARPVVTPVFDALGERTLWLGRAGAGSRAKLVVNVLLAFEVEAIAETRALAARLDVPYSALHEILTGSALSSAFEMTKLEKIERADDSADFPLEWALKDLDLATGAAGAGAAPITAAIAERWRGLVNSGQGRLDVSAARLGLDAATVGPGAGRS